MKFAVTCTAVAFAQCVSAAVDLKSIKYPSALEVVRNSYIVELSDGSHLKRGFSSPHEELYHDLKRRGVQWEVKKEYNDPLLVGATVKLGSAADLLALAQATGVQSITPVRLHAPPQLVSRSLAGIITTATQDGYSPHVMTGVDKLHAEGYFGKGVKIGIIDSGIDYTHPALGGKFGPGNKIIGGYDFVGDNLTSGAMPDSDPLDQCNGHGTHVAGIIGANPGNPWNISGVAYEAEINAYRVFSCSGSTPSDTLLDALLRAHNDGNDIITLSLTTGRGGWTEQLLGVVASRIAREGKIVTSSAGNGGSIGAWDPIDPGTGVDVISVGSIDNTVVHLQNATASNGRNISYQALRKAEIPDGLPLYTISICGSLPDSTPDLSTRVVVIPFTNCDISTQLANANAKGARYFVFSDNIDETPPALDLGQYQTVLVSKEDGAFLVEQAIPQSLTLAFRESAHTGLDKNGGLMSSFSSYSPTNDMYLKPALSAPGGAIVSTWPVALGSYMIASGTSQSCPFVAGASALLLQARGSTVDTARAARSIFQNTATPVKQTPSNTSLITTATHQGAGLINVYDAIKNIGSMLPAEILLNDTAYFRGTQELNITNRGQQSLTYTFSHVAAGTANTINGIEPVAGPLPLVDNAASVTITPNTLTVSAGQSATVVVNFKPPTGDAAQFPVYSGYIVATGSDNSILRSTYLGVAARLRDMRVIDDKSAFFGAKIPVILDKDYNPVPGGATETFTMVEPDTPLLVYRLVAGSPTLHIDLVDSKANASSVETLGVLYQEEYLDRDEAIVVGPDWIGFRSFEILTFANGTAIPNGSFKLRIRALKITGDPRTEQDYEVYYVNSTMVINRS